MKRIIYSLLFAAGTLFAGCSDDDTQAPLNTPIQEGNNLYGVVTDPNGAPVGGIVVSDGFSCVATDANGVYQMPRHADAFHVFYRIPADREIPMSEGRPCFWQRLSKTQERYDFVLMPQQAVETDFKLVCIADPQVQKDTDLARFKEESVPDIRAHVSTLEGPVYGITLGDIIFNEKAKDVTNQMMPPIALAMRESEIGLKLFQVMGNHDNCMTPTVTDESSNFDLAGRRNFEYKFGPCDYSFDRGNAHIVAMDDVLLTDEKHNPSDYEGGFTDAQVEWLRQDLSLVPKEKLVIFCVHIPLRNATSFNRETVRNLLKEFDNVHIMAGHTHYAQNYIDGDVYEHIHGAVCGAWWKSTINVDGTPNGYGVYDISGSKIENWYYKPTRLSKDFQIRMYRGETTFAGGYKFTYTASDEIVANIWNSDDRNWKVEVYENRQQNRRDDPREIAGRMGCGLSRGSPERESRFARQDHLRPLLPLQTQRCQSGRRDPRNRLFRQGLHTERLHHGRRNRTIRWWTTILRSPNSRSGHSANFHLGLTPYPANAMSNLF